MRDILSKLFGFLKYILFIAAFGLVLFCIMKTYARLQKPLTDAIDVFIPFGIVIILFVIGLATRSKSVGKNLLFNFVCTIVFVFTIVICLRSMFDTNMILYHRYNISFNPAFFSDNLSAVVPMLYMIASADLILLICDFINREKVVKVKEVHKEAEKPVKKSTKVKDKD